MSKSGSSENPALQTVEEMFLNDEVMTTLRGSPKQTSYMSKEDQENMFTKLSKFKYSVACVLVYRGVPTHYLLKSRRGDRFFVRLSCRDRDTSEHERVHISKTSMLSYVSPSLRESILETKTQGCCGAITICDSSICIIDTENGYEENTFEFEEEVGLFGTNKDSIVAYPVVNLCHIADAPFEYEKRITLASQKLLDTSIKQINILETNIKHSLDILLETRNFQLRALDAINQKNEKLKDMSTVFKTVELKDPTKFSVETQKEYERLLSDMSQLKEEIRDLVERLHHSYDSVGLLNSCEFEIFNSLQTV